MTTKQRMTKKTKTMKKPEAEQKMMKMMTQMKTKKPKMTKKPDAEQRRLRNVLMDVELWIRTTKKPEAEQRRLRNVLMDVGLWIRTVQRKSGPEGIQRTLSLFPGLQLHLEPKPFQNGRANRRTPEALRVLLSSAICSSEQKTCTRPSTLTNKVLTMMKKGT